MSAGVDTVIVAYGSDDVIGECVTAAAKLGGTVVVVDHSADGSSVEPAAAAGAVTVVDPTNPGFGAGQNRGVLRTTSPYVLLCNPDAEIEPSEVLAGVHFLEGHPEVAAVQGVVVNRVTGLPERSQGVALRPVHLLGRALGARRLLARPLVRRLTSRFRVVRDHAERIPIGPVAVEALAATAILVRRTAFDSVGGFDSRYFLYGEDLDLCRRLSAAGWALVALPGVWAVHDSGGSADSSVSRELHWWRGTMQYAAQWWTTGRWAAALLAGGLRVLTFPRSGSAGARTTVRLVVLEPAALRRSQTRNG